MTTPSPAPTPRRPVWERGTAEFDRVVLLSDAVIAIALTILVLDLHVPIVSDPQHDLVQAVRDEGSSFIAFGLTFTIIAVAWISHHQFVSTLARVDGAFIRWNFLYLFVICLMPYTSSLISEYASSSSFAVAVYIGLLIVLGAVGVLGELVVVRRGLGIAPGLTPQVRFHVIDNCARIAVLAIGVVIACVSPNPANGLLWLVVLWPVAALVGRRDPDRESHRPGGSSA